MGGAFLGDYSSLTGSRISFSKLSREESFLLVMWFVIYEAFLDSGFGLMSIFSAEGRVGSYFLFLEERDENDSRDPLELRVFTLVFSEWA